MALNRSCAAMPTFHDGAYNPRYTQRAMKLSFETAPHRGVAADPYASRGEWATGEAFCLHGARPRFLTMSGMF